mgnify:CR=1 FL=1
MLLFFIGLFIGANVSLFLYACIIAGRKADEHIIAKEENGE